MNKNKLVSPDGEVLVVTAPKIKKCRPTGSMILIENLSSQEALGTTLHVQDGAAAGAPQAYVLAVGPTFQPDIYGFNVGDRVLVQGTFVPVPNYDNNRRLRGLVDPVTVKAVLEEKLPE